ncbi:MAG: HAD family hydrolase [Candidatus Bathyarchaeia archaeon]
MERHRAAIKAVVFDLDGTLAEFNLDYKAVRAEAKQFLVNQGFPASIFSVNESIFEMLKKAQVYMQNNGKEKDFAAVQKSILAIASKHEWEAANKTSPLPGVFEVLKALKAMKLKLGIFTINSEKSTNLILDKFRLRQFFDATIAREGVPRVKPDPSHLKAALKALNVKPEEVAVVGDNAVDVKSAVALKATPIGVANSDTAFKDLGQMGAVHVVKSITELPALIAKLNKP